jgi:long-subunit fatty acid transport protein
MRHYVMAATAWVGAAGSALAGGIDRSGQPIGILFKEGNYLEFSASYTSPTVSGKDLAQAPPGFPFPYDSGARYNDVADSFMSYGFGLKYDVTEKFTVALTGAEDFGADIEYPDITGSLLGGTSAEADSYALTLMGRYKLTDNWSVHAGLRRDVADGTIKLNGLAYGGPSVVSPTGAVLSRGASGYEVKLGSDVAYGYLVGGAYEVPDIALRVAVTYFSPITHDFKTRETIPIRVGSPTGPDVSTTSNSARTDVQTPEALHIDFQTGIAEDTLVFGGIRWVDWSEFRIKPEQLGRDLVEINDTTTYTIGVARRFTERFAGSASFIYEPENSDPQVTPLAPVNGYRAIALGGSYRVDQFEISAGVRYAWLGEAEAETGTPDVSRARFSDNNAVSVGMRVGYYF